MDPLARMIMDETKGLPARMPREEVIAMLARLEARIKADFIATYREAEERAAKEARDRRAKWPSLTDPGVLEAYALGWLRASIGIFVGVSDEDLRPAKAVR